MTSRPIQPLTMANTAGGAQSPQNTGAKMAPGSPPEPSADAQQELAQVKLQEAQAKAQAAASPPQADTSAILAPVALKAKRLERSLPTIEGPSVGLKLKLAATFAKMAANDATPPRGRWGVPASGYPQVRSPDAWVGDLERIRRDIDAPVNQQGARVAARYGSGGGMLNYARDAVNHFSSPEMLQTAAKYSPAKFFFGNQLGSQLNQAATNFAGQFYNPEREQDLQSFFDVASPDLAAAEANMRQPFPSGPHVPMSKFDPKPNKWVRRTPQEFGPEMNADQWAAYDKQQFNDAVAARYGNGPAEAVMQNLTAPYIDQYTQALPAKAGWGAQTGAYLQDALGNAMGRAVNTVGGIPDAVQRAGDAFGNGNYLTGAAEAADAALVRPLWAAANIAPTTAFSPSKSFLSGLNNSWNAYQFATQAGQGPGQQQEVQALRDYADNPTPQPQPQPLAPGFMEQLWSQISQLPRLMGGAAAPQAGAPISPIRYEF